MSGGVEGRRALVAREVAALRRHGWPAGRALRLVADKSPPGADRDAIAAMASALEGGRAPDAQAEPFLAVLAQGDAAGPEALLDVARADEAERELRRGWWQAVALPAVLLCIALTSLAFMGGPGVVPFDESGGTLPGATVLMLQAQRILGWLTPFLVLGVALLAWKFPRDRMPGLRTLHAARLLRRFLAASSAGKSEEDALATVDPSAARLSKASALRLDQYERAMLHVLEAQGPAKAARVLASEMEAEARRSMRRMRVLGPTLGIVVAVLFLVGMMFATLAAFLPVFSMAGTIQ